MRNNIDICDLDIYDSERLIYELKIMQSFFDKSVKSKQPTSRAELVQLDVNRTSDILSPAQKQSSPRNELNHFNKEPTETVEEVVSTQSSKKISPRREVKQTNKEYSVSNPTDTKWKKSVNEGADTSKERVKDAQHNDLSTNTPKIIVDDTCNSTSCEHEGEPKQFFSLNLKNIISERTDERFHARVGAYFDKNLQRKPKSRITYITRLNFNDYCRYITDDLNALQRKKFQIIQSLVAILEPAYIAERRSEKNHNKFCYDLLEIIQCCMCVSKETCAKSNYLPDSRKSPEEKIALFWASATFGIKLGVQQENYDKLLGELMKNVDTSFILAMQLMEFQNQKQHRPSDENPFCCISWDYLTVLCDSHYISGDNLEQFKNSYKEICNGLAGEFIFLPHMWDFIRQSLNKESKHHSPYHDTLKSLDKLLLDTPVFADFEPESKNQSHFKNRLHIM